MDSPNGVSDENKETRKETVINVNSMCSILSPGVFLLSNILQIRSGISQESFSFQIFHKIGVASLNKALGEVKKSVLKQNLGTQNAPRRDVLALASFSGGSFGTDTVTVRPKTAGTSCPATGSHKRHICRMCLVKGEFKVKWFVK